MLCSSCLHDANFFSVVTLIKLFLLALLTIDGLNRYMCNAKMFEIVMKRVKNLLPDIYFSAVSPN